MDGKVAMDMSLITKIKDLFLNFLITVGIGILFIVVFPIVGCCFCCCRVVCRCCCDRPQTDDPKLSCKKKVYGTILFILATFTFVGNVCIFVSNGRMTVALDQLAGNVNNNMDDIATYLNTTIKQVEHIRNNFKATSDVITKELDGSKIAETLSERAITVLTNGTIQQLQTDIDKTQRTLTTVTTDSTTLSVNLTTLHTSIKAACGVCLPFPAPGKVASPPPLSVSNPMPNIISNLKTNIKTKLGTGITNQIDDAKNQISGLQTDIDKVVDGMKDAVHNAQGFDIDSTKDTVNNIVSSIKPYDKYRWYGGIGLATIVLLIVALQYFGLMFGILGSCGGKLNPTNKGCISNSGGRMLIASVALIFIFSSLLMLLTTALFVPGSMIERFICQPLSDPDVKVLDDILQKFIDLQNTMKYQQPVSLSDILSSCRNNKAAYVAFHLEESQLLPMKVTNLSDLVMKAKQKMDLSTALKGLTQNGGLTGTSIPTTDITTIGNNINTLDLTPVEHSIDTVKQSLNAMKQVVGTAMKTSPTKKLEQIRDKDFVDVEMKIKGVERNILTLKTLKKEISQLTPKVTTQLGQAQTNLASSGMKTITEGFVNRIFGIVDNFVSSTNTSVYEKLGNCEPLWNLYNSIIVVSVCSYTVDSLNGVWFSIGWCILFFIPSIIFSIKFSNLIRDVDLDENKEHSGSSSHIARRSNKVGHMDKIV